VPPHRQGNKKSGAENEQTDVEAAGDLLTSPAGCTVGRHRAHLWSLPSGLLLHV